MRYGFKRVAEKWDVTHSDDGYDGRFTLAQARAFAGQLLSEGHHLTDLDLHSEIVVPEVDLT